MMDLQFYPTPPKLAKKAWSMFKNKDFNRVLEPSAGNGDLALAGENGEYMRRYVFPDCVEIDVEKHATLRSKKLNVVGMDFMEFGSGSIYSHIIGNPPFAMGVQHTLKAWDILWDGEIVMILNAETIRNPYSRERQLLVSLIERHGAVEFVEGAFMVEEAERKTSVDVALVWLKKTANVSADIIGPLLSELNQDQTSFAADYKEANEVALPASVIDNLVTAFNAAVRTMKEAVFAEARANYYVQLLGDTMADRCAEKAGHAADVSAEFVKKEMGKRYADILDRAWSNVLRSSNVTSKLSSAAQKRVESEFAQISKLEFTVKNIYGFLCGLVESQGKIQIEMVCDVFDEITRYHTDNTVFVKGWKSNDRHRTAGMKIKTTRFVLPRHSKGFGSGLSWESMQLLRDFDKVFALLEGKVLTNGTVTTNGCTLQFKGLEYVFNNHFNELRAGQRVESEYFDVRWYGGVGTIHFFPRNKKLIDRLNRMVGRHRKWLPPEGARVSDDFWLAYDKAESFDKEVRQKVNSRRKYHWDDPLRELFHKDEGAQRAAAMLDEVLTEVLEGHGINTDFLLENGNPEQLLLAA